MGQSQAKNVQVNMNDVYKLCAKISSDIYITDSSPDKFDYTIKDPSGKDTSVVYRVERHLYHEPIHAELCALYLCTSNANAFAIIGWKGTWSVPQSFLDIGCKFESLDVWRKQLKHISKGFMKKLSRYVTDQKIDCASYLWFITGHSLGGALASMTEDILLVHPEVLPQVTSMPRSLSIPWLHPTPNHPPVRTVTFASMKLPVPCLDNDNDANYDFSEKNNVIEFFNGSDNLPEWFCPSGSVHIGHPRIDIQPFVTIESGIAHSVSHFLEFVESHDIEIEPSKDDSSAAAVVNVKPHTVIPVHETEVDSHDVSGKPEK